jgi:hypothetical protein
MPFRPTFRAVTDGRRHPRWLWSYRTNGMPELKNFAAVLDGTSAAQAAVLRREMDASFGWDDLRRLRDEWPGTFLVKEIVTLEDSARGAEAGVDGVVVSNHGGKQLADLPTPIDVRGSRGNFRTVRQQRASRRGCRQGCSTRRTRSVARACDAVWTCGCGRAWRERRHRDVQARRRSHTGAPRQPFDQTPGSQLRRSARYGVGQDTLSTKAETIPADRGGLERGLPNSSSAGFRS